MENFCHEIKILLVCSFLFRICKQKMYEQLNKEQISRKTIKMVSYYKHSSLQSNLDKHSFFSLVKNIEF